MKKIYKYDITPKEISEVEIEIPVGAQILKFDSQFEVAICIWALIDPTAEVEKRTFSIMFTGEELTEEFLSLYSYKTTVALLNDSRICHIFEKTR